ncbi:Protein NETWORKED 1D [Glycine soja]
MAVGNHQRGTTKEPKNRYPSTDSLVEKELNVDKLELSRRLTLPREEGNQSKILERLHCDAQKLRNLQITIQDLMKKVEINEKSTKGKSVEFGEVKGHQSKLTWVHLIPTYCIASKIAESTPW